MNLIYFIPHHVSMQYTTNILTILTIQYCLLEYDGQRLD